MDQKEIKAKVRRAVVIGLGGTGLLSVLYTKKILQQYYGGIPLSLKFLVIDTTQSWGRGLKFMDRDGIIWKDAVIEPQEFIYLMVGDPLAIINTSTYIKESYPRGIPTEAILHGAGAVRAHGWLALHANARVVEERLSRILIPLADADLGRKMEEKQNLLINMDQADTVIYIVGSMAGGTGSGCFIDIAFLMRHFLKKGLSKINGFLILPWVFKGLPVAGRGRIFINAYAALKELEYYMDFNYKTDKVPINFGGREIFGEKPPFDWINLVDGRNENGINLVDGGSFKGVENLCELIGMSIALNIGSVGKINDDVLDNLTTLIATQDVSKWENKKPHYSSFGISTLVYPIEKHFNRAYSLYSFLLIDEGMRISKKKAIDVNFQEVENDIRNFCNRNEVRLLDENNHVIDDIFRPGSMDTDIQLQEGVEDGNELKGQADIEEQRIMGVIDSQLPTNITQKKEKAVNLAVDFIREKEKKKDINYSLRCAEGLLGQMKSYRETRSKEIEEMESQMIDLQNASQQLFEKIEDIGFLKKIMGGKKEAFRNYLDQRNLMIKTRIEIKRRRGSLEVFDLLIKEAEDYIKKIDLPETERRLSKVREMIYKDLFTTSYLPIQFGEYAIIEEPLKIIVRGEKGKVKTSKGNWDDFKDFLKDQGIGWDFNEFLEEYGLTFGQLSEMNEEELRKKIIAFAQKKVSFIKDMTLEEVLQFGLEKEKEKEEILKKKLNEASLRATPLWYHKVMGERASLMEELFIIGVGDEGKSRLKTEDYGIRFLPYLNTKQTYYPPDFTSTKDPYKIFFFKYKAPLPAHLLQDMDDYRKEYHSTPLSMTPHVKNGMELIAKDLFPFTPVDKRYLRIFTMAMTPPFQLIKEKWVEKGRLMANVFYVDDSRVVVRGEEILGESKQKAYDEFGEERKRELREKLLKALKEDCKGKDSAQLKSDLRGYLGQLEKEMGDEMKRLEKQMGESKFTIGDALLLSNEIGVLKEFDEFKGEMSDFLDKVV
jgi:hypothetical protein